VWFAEVKLIVADGHVGEDSVVVKSGHFPQVLRFRLHEVEAVSVVVAHQHVKTFMGSLSGR
jgi:hypothetical protein